MNLTRPIDMACPVHHTATVDEPWNGPAAVAAMPNDAATLKATHAWMDMEGEPDAKSSYKFPHHKTKGGPANLAACRNGLARLSQANIPDSDRDGVRQHLQAHLDDANPENKTTRIKSARPKARLRARNDWYRIKNEAGSSTAEVHIYDEIGYWGVTAQQFVKEMQSIDANQIDVHLNTPGGDVYDGIAIHNALKQHKANVTVYVDSLAASIGSVIAMAGDEVVMAKYSQMMIHDASGVAVGANASEMREMADLLDRCSNNIAQVYADKTGTDPDMWREAMMAESWYSAEEAVEVGLADRVDSGNNVRIENDWDLSIYNYSGREYAPAPTASARTPARDVLAAPRTSTETRTDPREQGTPAEGVAFAFDPDVFRAAMSFAADPPVPEEEAPFEFDPDIFRAVLADRANNAPAIAQNPEPQKPATFADAFDPEFFAALIREVVA